MPRTLLGMSKWCLFGKFVPRPEIVFICQVIAIYAIITASTYNLSVDPDKTSLWVSLLSSCFGYLLPSPTINKEKHEENVLHDTPEQSLL